MPYDVEIKPEWRRSISDGKQLAKNATISRKYDIPYLAGAHPTKSMFFIDRHVPKGFMDKGRMVRTDKYLAIHEFVERELMKVDGLPYFKGKSAAHKIATDEELAAVKADGIDVKKYNAFMNKYVKEAGSEDIKYPPPKGQLFEKPYQEEHDTKDLKKLNT